MQDTLNMQGKSRSALKDRASLQQAIRDADIVTLLLVLTQLTGDGTLLRSASEYIKGAWNFQHELPQGLQEVIREQLLVAIDAHGKGELSPPPIRDNSLLDWMSAAVGSQVRPEYLPLLLEEMNFFQDDSRAVSWKQPPAQPLLDSARVIIIGAGPSGICSAIRLKQMGIPFVVLEKNPSLGGTWFENTYPGVAVDVANHFFSFSFFTKSDWPRHFSNGAEVLAYLQECAERFGILSDIRFSTNAVSAEYDSKAASWSVTCEKEDGQSQRFGGHFLICAVGQLNQPFMPQIKDIETFTGPKFHTARWDHDVALKGRKVAIIGTGASAMQVAPSIASEVDKLSIFQRSPHWAMNNPNYHKTVPHGLQWAMANIPFYSEWYRFQLFWAASDGFHKMLHVNPNWSHLDVSLNEENHQMRTNLIQYIRSQLNDDEDLIRKAIPDYPPYGKRMLRDNHWYQMLKRSNVELVTQPIDKAVTDGLICTDGTKHEADVIIYSTGFQASKMIFPLDVKGQGGVTLRSVWGDDDPRAYLGITVPNFPNMFIVYGPNTNLAHGGSIIFHTECQVRYITSALRQMIEGGYRSFECRTEVHDDFNRRLDEQHSKMVWAHTGVNSWYKNKSNRVTMTSPWRLLDYWAMTKDFKTDDYILT